MQGSHFYRIIHNFIDQSGADVESVFGGMLCTITSVARLVNS